MTEETTEVTSERRFVTTTIGRCRAIEVSRWIEKRAFMYCGEDGDAHCLESGTLLGTEGENAWFKFGETGRFCVPATLVTLPTDDKPRWFESFASHPWITTGDDHRWCRISVAIRDTLTEEIQPNADLPF